MSGIKALEKLRDLRGCIDIPMLKNRLCDETNTHSVIDALEAIADEAKAEIAERFIEQPVGADGITIQVGDLVASRDWCEPREVTGFAVLCRTSDGGCVWNEPCELEHFVPRTLEDVLKDLLRDFTGRDMDYMGEVERASFTEYADEIRELLGVSE